MISCPEAVGCRLDNPLDVQADEVEEFSPIMVISGRVDAVRTIHGASGDTQNTGRNSRTILSARLLSGRAHRASEPNSLPAVVK